MKSHLVLYQIPLLTNTLYYLSPAFLTFRQQVNPSQKEPVQLTWLRIKGPTTLYLVHLIQTSAAQLFYLELFMLF